MTNAIIGVYKLNEKATIPSFATEESACFDIHACLENISDTKGISGYNIKNQQISIFPTNDNSIIIEPGDRILIPTGLIFVIAPGYSIRLHPRSGLALKKGLTLANAEGVIDSDYYHETFVALINTSSEPAEINHNDRIAQAELVRSNYSGVTKLKQLPSMPEKRTSRDGGFGSTGDQ